VNRRASQNKSSDRSSSSQTSHFPKAFTASVNFKHHFRFRNLAASTSAYSITRADLLDLLMVAKTTSSAARIFAGVKLNRVEIFDPGWVNGSAPTGFGQPASLEWTSNLGPTTLRSDTGNSFVPAHVVTTPPPQSLASFWSISGSNETEVLFTITVHQQSIIDVWFDFVLFNGETPVNIAPFTPMTVGQLYAGFLDGVGSTAQLQPESYLPIS